jgi:hypothetical protein
MGRFRRKILDDYNSEMYNPDERYNLAYKRVKRIKGFYFHLMVYLIFNGFIIIANSNESIPGNQIFWSWENFSTALFWGIGLLAHGLSVFGRNIFFGQNWEEKKIKEFMDKENKKTWE